jgi:hypothetical protein
VDRVVARLSEPLDAAGLAAFRIIFGLVVTWSTVRFQLFGWVHELFVKPTFFFKYWGFHWVTAPPVRALYALHVALTLLGVCITVGFFYRIAIVLFFIGFTYLQLLDVTNYLNHYVLVCLLALLLSFMPLDRAYSIDAWRRPEIRVSTFPAWQTYLLRFQIGVVYFYAGIAKLGSDWLLHAQPLSIWLSARTSTPVLGAWFDQPWVAYVFSWAGFLFDTSIVGFLLARRTRPFAYAVVVVFHLMTDLLFPIGMFPVIMMTSALVFFSPSWPRRFFPRSGADKREPSSPSDGDPGRRTRPPLSKPWLVVGVAYCAFQVLLPLRHRLYGGNVLWHEQGMRFAWKVMVREKNAAVTYLVEEPTHGRVWEVSPHHYLTTRQLREFSSQPDLILQLAHHIAEDYRARGYGDVKVRVEAKASLNGRRAAVLIDPSVDLTRISDGIAPAHWILPAPASPPPRLSPNHA